MPVTTPTGRPSSFEHPPLLDVELEVGGEGVGGSRRLADPGGVEAGLPHRPG